MQARPNNAELATAVREFLEAEIMPTITDARLKFRTLVAMNALSMLERAPLEEGFLLEEIGLLAGLLGAETPVYESRAALGKFVLQQNQQLSSQIRARDVPDGTLQALKQIAVAKLKVASPSYLKRVAKN